MKPRPTVWFFHDHADAYLLAAAHMLARAATRPEVGLLPAPSAVATMYCAFAAEAYVNVALARLLGADEYAPISRINVRTKYFLATRLGIREEWFEAGERALEDIDELMSQRNRLVHSQPQRFALSDPTGPPEPEPHEDLSNVARWIAATAEAVVRLGKSHGELDEFSRIAQPLLELDYILDNFNTEKDGPELERRVRALNRTLTERDERDFMPEDDLSNLLDEQDMDWDLRGLD